MSTQTTKPYCGLKSCHGAKKIFDKLAKLVIIYETKIIYLSTKSDFEKIFSGAYGIFKERIHKYVTKGKCAQIEKFKVQPECTLMFNSNKYQAADLCRHLRNSFAHALLRAADKKLFINDVNDKKQTSSAGYLEIPCLDSFLTELIKEYEKSFTVENV